MQSNGFVHLKRAGCHQEAARRKISEDRVPGNSAAAAGARISPKRAQVCETRRRANHLGRRFRSLDLVGAGRKSVLAPIRRVVPGFHDVRAFRRDPNDPMARERLSGAGCPLPGLLGHVGDDPHPPWLEFYVDASDEEIRGLSEHVRMRVETYVLPWLERFHTLDDIVKALKEPPQLKKKESEVTYHTLMDDRYRAAAAVEFVAGEHEVALKTVKSAFAQWTRRRRPEFLSEFNDHLLSMIEAVRRKGTAAGKAE